VDNFCPADKSFEQSGPDASRSVHVSPTHNFWPWHWFHGWLTRTKFVILYIAKSIIQLFIWYGGASLGIHDRLPYNIWLWPYFHGWTILSKSGRFSCLMFISEVSLEDLQSQYLVCWRLLCWCITRSTCQSGICHLTFASFSWLNDCTTVCCFIYN
jgi:hypothetical protein